MAESPHAPPQEQTHPSEQREAQSRDPERSTPGEDVTAYPVFESLHSARVSTARTRPAPRPLLRPRVNARPTAQHRSVDRSEEHTSELQSRPHLVCRLLL